MVVLIEEKYGLVLDDATFRVGVAKPGVYKICLGPLEDQLDILESAVDELFDTLSPTTTYKMAQPNREGATNTAGFITMLTLGLMFGILTIAIVLYGLGLGGV